jgi:hypothetical protein
LAGNKAYAHSTPSDYVISCPCNNETPKTSKPLKQGDNQTDSSITQVMQEEADQVISFLVKISAGLSKEGTCPMIDSPMAADSRTA